MSQILDLMQFANIVKYRLHNHLWGLASAVKNYSHFKQEYQQLLPILQRGECVCLVPHSLGDTLLFFECQNLIEKRYQLTCYPVIRSSQEVIAKLCGVKEYRTITDMHGFLRWLILYHQGENLGFKDRIGFKNTFPKKGEIFVAHFGFLCASPKIENREKEPAGHRFLRTTLAGYGLPEDTPLPHKRNLANISSSRVPSKQKIALLAPDALTVYLPQQKHLWTEIAKRLQQKNFTVVYNSIAEHKYLSPYATWLNCNLEQVVAVAKDAEQVIALRSGLCDILVDLGSKLHVIYPSESSYQQFALDGIFGTHNVEEHILETPEKLFTQLGL